MSFIKKLFSPVLNILIVFVLVLMFLVVVATSNVLMFVEKISGAVNGDENDD